MAARPWRYWNSGETVGFSDDSGSFTDIAFGFFEDSSSESGNYNEFHEEDEINPCDAEESKKFWETQNQLLRATLFRTTSLETKIRQSTTEAIREINEEGMSCICQNPAAGGCLDCLRRKILVRLQDEGYNCAICKCKWKKSQDIPSGEHTYLEVVEKTCSKKEVRVVIELNFRDEFEMARGSEEYNELINRLPEVFVGKAERLKALIKILCSAAKTCMKEKKMHLGPWRKHKYMQSKWFGKCERTAPGPLPGGFSDRLAKSKASMLTYDLSEILPVMHCTAVKVL